MNENLVEYTVGFFLSPQYVIHEIPVIELESIKQKKNQQVNHYQNAYVNNFKQNTNIRSFQRNQRLNFR